MKPFLLLISLSFCSVAHAQTKVTVRVLDPKNAPIAGANVAVQIWRGTSAKTIAPQVTDQNGAAILDVPASETGKPNGSISVVAAGFAFENASLAGKDLEIHLEPGVTWRGKVADEAGKPIEGASVQVSGARSGRDWDSAKRLFGEKNSAAYTSKSGADGSFAIKDVPAKIGLQWNIEHPIYAAKNGYEALPEVEMSIKLAPGGSLHGRVLDLAGKPIAGAMVYASLSQFGGGNDGTSNEKGEFRRWKSGGGARNSRRDGFCNRRNGARRQNAKTARGRQHHRAGR